MEDFSSDKIQYSSSGADITVKADSSMFETFYLQTLSNQGVNSIAKEIRVFVCGSEEVTTNGGRIDLSWEDDTDYSISAADVIASFTSTEPARCPVVSYYLTYDLFEGGTATSLSDGQIALTSSSDPLVSFQFAEMF